MIRMLTALFLALAVLGTGIAFTAAPSPTQVECGNC